MKDLFEKLAELADDLDKIAAPGLADEVDALMQGLKKEVEERAGEEDTYMTICPLCEGSGSGENNSPENLSPWCELCKGQGFVKGASSDAPVLTKISYIRHEDGKWNVYSKKGKRMGSYPSKKKAQERLKQIDFFKHKG